MEIEKLKQLIRDTHGVASIHIATEPVVSFSRLGRVWEVEVEIFELIGHATASRAYGWKRDAADEPANPERHVAVLHDRRMAWCAEAAVRNARPIRT